MGKGHEMTSPLEDIHRINAIEYNCPDESLYPLGNQRFPNPLIKKESHDPNFEKGSKLEKMIYKKITQRTAKSKSFCSRIKKK